MIKLNYVLSMAAGVLNKHVSFHSILLTIYIIVFAVNCWIPPKMDFLKGLLMLKN